MGLGAHASAQPRIRDRVQSGNAGSVGNGGSPPNATPGSGGTAGAVSTGGTGGTTAPAGTAAPAGTTAPSPSPAPSGTGTQPQLGGPTTPPKGPAGAPGPGGKTQGDTTSLSQFENALEFEPRSPNYRVAFSLEDADLAELVRVIAQLTGKRFIFGGKVKNIKATVYSPQKVTVAEAYQAFLSILETNGLTVVPHGRFLKIVETNQVANQGTPIYGATQGAPAEDRFVTRMHRLGHISADDAANVLGKFKSKEADITVYGPGNMIIVTDTGTNIRRMMQILEEIDVGSSGDQIFIEPIHYASASDVEKRINELFDVKSSGPGPSSSPKPGGGSTTSVAPSVGDLHVAKIVADDRSNSLVIVATERAYLRILELIKRIDIPQTGEGEIHVLALQHADAVELTKTLNDIISGSGGSTPTPGGGGRGQAAPSPSAPPAGVFEGGVKVSADKATNSIVVTSSLRDYASLRLVIERLDQPRRQVFIEAVIMDLQLKRSDSFGVSFHGGAPFQTDQPNDSVVFGGNKITNTIPPVPTDPDALQGFALGVRGPGISGSQNFLGTGISIPAFGTFIQALARTGDSDLLSTPHILALDNEDAEINVGDNIPLQTNAVSAFPQIGAAGGAAGAAGLGALGGLGGFGSFGSPRQDVGTKIKIKPHLNDSNEVRLDVAEEISEQGAPLGGTLGAIPISKRTATTKLVVQDQQTVVIGGLIRNVTARAEEKVPVLGDIPVLGALFRKRTNTMEKRNLVLVMTPYIIRNQQDLRTVFERKMQERQEYLDRYFIFSDSSEYKPPKDWSRTNGLVEDIRQSYFQLEEKKRLDEITRPRELKTHDPQRPLEMPQGVPRSSSGGPERPNLPNPVRDERPGGATPPVNVNPAVRNIEKIEK
ncbi:MAG: type II secretion system secretin GspD [Deltaproteobacteria bacterium]|nr:type II secretion system secretin GspD [Deltaproteobacteria bacterium]